jgi:AcrR family transcriptional regulator
MAFMSSMPSPRRTEILHAAYQYVLEHGLVGASLRPVAVAVGSSTGVLRFLFGSKDGLVKAILERAREDELTMLQQVQAETDLELAEIGAQLWAWLSDPEHRPLLVLWVESYASSLLDDSGPWADFARSTVDDWLALLAQAQPAKVRNTAGGRAERTTLLALLRGALLDLLATGDRARTTRAVTTALAAMH